MPCHTARILVDVEAMPWLPLGFLLVFGRDESNSLHKSIWSCKGMESLELLSKETNAVEL